MSESDHHVEESDHLIHSLNERVKELNCLYDISRLYNTPGADPAFLLEKAAGRLPGSWQYPEIAVSCITYDGEEYCSGESGAIQHSIAADIMVKGACKGTITVAYTRAMPGDPFLEEERRLLSAVADITGQALERYEARRQLAEAERKYRDLTETLPQAVFEFDFSGKFLYVNEAGLSMFGFEREDMESTNLAQLIDRSDYGRVGQAVEKMADGISDGAVREYLFKRKDGSVFPGRAYTTLITDEKGARVGVRGLMTDVTEERKYIEELEDREARLRGITQAAKDAILLVDSNGTILHWNPAAELIFGYTADEAVGKHINLVIPHHARKQHSEEFKDYVVSPGIMRDEALVEYSGLNKDGTEFPAEISISRVRIHDEDFVEVVVRNITERQQYEEQLRRKNVELEGYAHTVSHDLKTPLTSVTIALDMMSSLLKEDLSEKDRLSMHEMLEMSVRSTDRMVRLIDDLLFLAESGEPTDVCPVRVSERLEEVLLEQRPAIEDKHIEVRADPDLGTMEANPTHIYQVFSNLIKNAVRHVDSAEPVLEVRLLESRGGTNKYLVRDNGPGIDQHVIEDMFTPFVKGEGGDSGIGLSIVDKIVKTYGGEIKAYNDNGACFEFTLRDWT